MEYNFITDNQIRRATGQFMRALSGFHVSDGPEDDQLSDLKRVPVIYGELDRIVAQLISSKEQIAQKVTIPIMACTLTTIELDAAQRKARKHKDVMYDHDEIGDRTLERLIGPPLILNYDVAIVCSSNTELFQLLEQILLIFNPRVTITVDDRQENADYITEIQLTSMSQESNWPIGTGTQARAITLSFQVPFRLRYPHRYVNNVIKEINLRVFDEDSGDEAMNSWIPDKDD